MEGVEKGRWRGRAGEEGGEAVEVAAGSSKGDQRGEWSEWYEWDEVKNVDSWYKEKQASCVQVYVYARLILNNQQ